MVNIATAWSPISSSFASNGHQRLHDKREIVAYLERLHRRDAA
jgi:hypothetical protein